MGPRSQGIPTFLKTDIDPDGAGHWGAIGLPAGMSDTNWGGSFLVIPEQSENKEAAWAFVKYMLATTEGQNTMFKAIDYFPAYKPAWDAEENSRIMQSGHFLMITSMPEHFLLLLL